jgi:Holliday junction DNA helicase RuvB
MDWSVQRRAFLFHPERIPSPLSRSPRKKSEKRSDGGLRPEKLPEFVGQGRVVKNLGCAIQAARLRGEPLGLNKACQECLYSALEDGVVDLLVSELAGMRTLRIELERFTFVGATTHLGALSEPFRARFRLEKRLEFYREEELSELIQRAAARLRISVTKEASRAIAQRARGIPRLALRLLEHTRDLVTTDRGDRSRIEVEDVVRISHQLGMDERGLWPEDRRLLAVLIGHRRPMGLEATAVSLRMDLETIRSIHEPYLVERGTTGR